jgi:predicted ATP-grasp superfamily ATP-dependent carboligase
VTFLYISFQYCEEGDFTNILVVEYISSGGFVETNIPSTLFPEGFGMLNSVTRDLKHCGQKVIVPLDFRIKNYRSFLNIDETQLVTTDRSLSYVIESVSKPLDAIMVIAPELSGILYNLRKLAEQLGIPLLDSSSNATRILSNKVQTEDILKKRGISVPETVICEISDDLEYIKEKVEEIGYPLIFKPVDGVGCGGLSLVTQEKQISESILNIKQNSTQNRFMVQKYIEGAPASINCISDGKHALPVSFNAQFVTFDSLIGGQSEYEGGFTPFHHELEEKAEKAIIQFPEHFPGLLGYFGVDLIFTEDEVFFIEINPRITTSYIGARAAIQENIMNIVIKAVFEGQLPKEIVPEQFAYFKRITLEPDVIPLFPLEFFRKSEIVSPPYYDVSSKEEASFFANVTSRSLESCKSRILALEREIQNKVNSAT